MGRTALYFDLCFKDWRSEQPYAAGAGRAVVLGVPER
jgi:hypothetical protein